VSSPPLLFLDREKELTGDPKDEPVTPLISDPVELSLSSVEWRPGLDELAISRVSSQKWFKYINVQYCALLNECLT